MQLCYYCSIDNLSLKMIKNENLVTFVVKYLFKLNNFKIIINNFIFASIARIIIKCDD